MPNLPDDPTKNVAIWNDDESKTVTVTTDGAKERLDVSASIVGGTFNLGAFIPDIDFETATPVALNTSTDTSLKSETGHAGKLDFIGIQGNISTYEVILKVDGIEVFRLTMSEVGSTLDLTGTTGLQVPMWTETANKNFRYHPNEGLDFTDSFEILAKAVSGNPSVTWIVTHRDEA